MKTEKLLNAMGSLSDELVKDAAIAGRTDKKRFLWKPFIVSAACLCLLLTAAFSARHFLSDRPPEVTGPTASAPQLDSDALKYGQIDFFSAANKVDAGVSGTGYQWIDGTSNPTGGLSTEPAVPKLFFSHVGVQVVAKAVEDLGIYEELYPYGWGFYFTQYRVIRMEVIDPLESGLEGTFYYLLPADLTGDLTQYDAFLISMYQRPKNDMLRGENQITAFEYLFQDHQEAPERGCMIPFTDGVFDVSLWEIWWQDRSHRYGYEYLKDQLENEADKWVVFEGATLEEALQRRKLQTENWDATATYRQAKQYDFQSKAARQAMVYWKPFENGVFCSDRFISSPDRYGVRRYIGGCPTNEWYYIDLEDEKITASEYAFTDEDFENLPDLAAYIASLDLAQIAPQHTDTAGKVLIYNSAAGWYEKTESGVYSIVRIAWRYYDEENTHIEYYDETFILLSETGDHIISREELKEQIGENPNISEEAYGVGIPMPMV